MELLRRDIRIGLQVKAVLILALMVLLATMASGWIYYSRVCTWLRQHELIQAGRLAEGLSLSASDPMRSRNNLSLQMLAKDFLNTEGVLYIAFLDADGQEIATASTGDRGRAAQPASPESSSISYTHLTDDHCLVVVRPILGPAQANGIQVLGSVRLTFETNLMASCLRQAHNTMLLLACLCVIFALPVGYMLVWRVLVLPIRRLMQATRKLAEGDFSTRAVSTRNDELGMLAESFNAMATQIDIQHQQLVAANEQLEKKVEQRTAELNRANVRLSGEIAEKEDFLRAVSHDLNAPLRNIAGMTTMVMMKWRDQLPEEATARLQRVLANVESETELISELLELSRIKSRPQRREMTDMAELLRQVAASFDYDLKACGIEIDLPSDTPWLYIERNRMRQVFQNLIDNAIKYMSDRPDKRISITYRLVDDEHVFAVSDNGPGIAREDQQRIFYVFRRASNAQASKVPGKGVGLASVKSIVSNYDGRIWVESELGAGSTFYVALSRRCTDAPTEESNHGVHQTAAAGCPDDDSAGG